MSKRNSVTCVKPSDPPFLKKLKERVGYKEGPSIDTKRERRPVDDVDPDLDDEKPVVVVLEAGDLTAEEAEMVIQSQVSDDEPSDGKIMFKKPTKRKDSTSPTDRQAKRLKEVDKSRRQQANSVRDSRLLSFGDDDDVC
ncbi:hypothetical protein MRX96_018566 [Rhipicephalus microplus]|uniref:DUF4604 domain-containing protein n=1 Tax=Rhipicephalus microplus TaxID=6941 RepID=A0A6G5AEK2_RHIMP|nr:uncharacterized protein KIAA1143 homolog isoform X1 [Rhipicephalus microplus]